MPINVITYPRSGSRFLRDLLHQSADPEKIDLFFSHTPGYYDPELLTFAVIRNPFDSICSIVAMDMHNFPENEISKLIKRRINYYILFYKDILENFDAWFDYDFLVNKPSKVVDIILDKSGIKRTNFTYENTLKDRPEKHVLNTSKTSAYYDSVKENLRHYDLSECESIYEKLLSLSVKG